MRCLDFIFLDNFDVITQEMLKITLSNVSSDQDGRAAALPWRHSADEGEEEAGDCLHCVVR